MAARERIVHDDLPDGWAYAKNGETLRRVFSAGTMTVCRRGGTWVWTCFGPRG